MPCPAPLYCVGGNQYAACPLGTFSAVAGLSALTDCPPCPANSFCQTSGDIEPCPAHTSAVAGSVSKLSCLCDPGYQCTYSKAVRVNVTLPLTQAQFDLVRAQFLQAIAAAAGVDQGQVSIIGQTVLNPPPPQNRTRRMALAIWAASPQGGHELLVEAHVAGVEHLPLHRVRRRLLLRGLRARHARVRQVHALVMTRWSSGWM